MVSNLRTASGAVLSGFCFGTMQWGGKADAADSRKMFNSACKSGINFFDTALFWPHTANLTPHPAHVAPLADKNGRRE